MANNSYFGPAALASQLHFLLILLLIACGKFNIGLCCGREFDSNEIQTDNGVNDHEQAADRSLARRNHHTVEQLESNPSSLLTTSRVHLKSERFSETAHKMLRPTTAAAAYNPAAKYYIHRKLRASTPLCSIADLSITQGFSGYSNGIPVYTVQIVNLCLNPRCEMSNIHVACEAFSSARPLDALVFHRLAYNDCFLMNGAPLGAGASVAFEYANSSEYPMHIISAEVGSCTPAAAAAAP